MIAVQQPTDVPANAPDHCPGTESDLAGKVDACEGCPNQDICASGQSKSTAQDPTTIPMINERLAGVKRKILVLSGKGGVGKSTFTSQLGWALAADEDVQVSSFSFPPHSSPFTPHDTTKSPADCRTVSFFFFSFFFLQRPCAPRKPTRLSALPFSAASRRLRSRIAMDHDFRRRPSRYKSNDISIQRPPSSTVSCNRDMPSASISPSGCLTGAC